MMHCMQTDGTAGRAVKLLSPTIRVNYFPSESLRLTCHRARSDMLQRRSERLLLLASSASRVMIARCTSDITLHVGFFLKIGF